MFASKVNICFNASFPIVKLSRKCTRDKNGLHQTLKYAVKGKINYSTV